MADLDVTDILLDPDFCDLLNVTRTTQSVGSNGIVTNTTTTLTPYGVITIGSPKGVIRTAEYEADTNMITVHTRGFRLIDAQPGKQPDIVVFGGDPYVVKKSYNWSHYGAGFTMAECELQSTVTTS
jgi:hypothetical protein